MMNHSRLRCHCTRQPVPTTGFLVRPSRPLRAVPGPHSRIIDVADARDAVDEALQLVRATVICGCFRGASRLVQAANLLPLSEGFEEQAVDHTQNSQTCKPWESVRLVCSDGTVPASLEMLSMVSPVLRDRITVAVSALVPPSPSDDGRMAVIDQPIEVKVPESTVAEWQELLKHVSPVFPRPTLTPEIMHKLLPLAHKMGMTDFLSHCDLELERQLPEQLTMSPTTSPAYLMKWLAAADQFNLVKTRAVCLDSIRVGKGRLAGLTTQDQLLVVYSNRRLYRYSWAPDSFYRQVECSSDELMIDMQQLSPATLAMMFKIMHDGVHGIVWDKQIDAPSETVWGQLLGRLRSYRAPLRWLP